MKHGLAALAATLAAVAAQAAEPALDLTLRAVPHALVPPAAAGNRLAQRIERAADFGWYRQMVQGAIEAVIECQKGDYPGGGMGVLSMPAGRPAAPSDHCRKL